VSEVRAVLLDLYDTLVWSDWPKLRVMIEERTGLSTRALLDAFDVTRPARSVGAHADEEGNIRAVLQAAGVDPSPDLVAELAELVEITLATGVHLFDDSIPVLRELRTRGLSTAIVSNCDHATRAEVERLGLYEEVDAVVLSFEVRVAKPDPEIYRAALDAVGARPEEAVFVDDQARYCEGAEAIGIRSLMIVRDDAAPAEGFGPTGDRLVLHDLRSLLDLV
jgi:putative hydrolase of the HAD superfamily